jgi:hypothetical protein
MTIQPEPEGNNQRRITIEGMLLFSSCCFNFFILGVSTGTSQETVNMAKDSVLDRLLPPNVTTSLLLVGATLT